MSPCGSAKAESGKKVELIYMIGYCGPSVRGRSRFRLFAVRGEFARSKSANSNNRFADVSEVYCKDSITFFWGVGDRSFLGIQRSPLL